MSIDQKINALFEVVRTQKMEVEEAEKESKQSWKTNCTVHLEWRLVQVGAGVQNVPTNIQTATEDNIKRLVIALLQHREYAKQAEVLLGLEPTDKYDGFAYDDWFTDCKKRIAVIGLRAKKDKLAEMEKRLNAIVSPEQKRQMELDAIAKSLGM